MLTVEFVKIVRLWHHVKAEVEITEYFLFGIVYLNKKNCLKKSKVSMPSVSTLVRRLHCLFVYKT